MKTIHIILAAFLIILLIGCASKDQVYESIYEGLQSTERMRNPDRKYPADADKEPMNYQQYKLEREKLLKKDNE